MDNSIVNVGDKIDLIELSPKKNGEKHPEKQYVSSLLEEPDGNEMKISMPIDSGKIIPLPVGGKYLMVFYTQKGLYQCKCEIIKRYKEERMFVMIVRTFTALERNQRREFFRLNCIIDILYRAVSTEEIVLQKRVESGRFLNDDDRKNCLQKLEQLQNDFLHEGVVTDISGGGLRFNSTKELEKDKELVVKIVLPADEGEFGLNLHAEVISSIANPNHHNSFDNRLRFVNLEDEDREKIIKFVFAQERKNLRREKGL